MEIGKPDYSFALLIDVSSSQSPRSKPLLQAAVLVAEALDRAGLPFLCIPWCDSPETMKPFRAKLNRHRGHLAGAIGHPRGGTYEAPALGLAYDELRRQMGFRTLITITDGETTRKDESKRVISELQSINVDCIGIAVAYSKEPAHYPKRMKTMDPRTLATILPKLIVKKVPKGV
jgi:hypothetical protein